MSEKSSKKLHFVEDVTYNGEIAHKKGSIEVVDNSTGYADRWIKRGKATVVVEESKEEKAAKAVAEKAAKAVAEKAAKEKLEAEEKAKAEAEAKAKAEAEKAASQKPANVANAKATVNNKENDL